MKLLRILSNKFMIAIMAFLVWLLFFDQNDYFTQRERRKDLKDLEDNISYLNTEIAKMEKEYEALKANPEKLERYARERYRMKRDNEDVYVIEEK